MTGRLLLALDTSTRTVGLALYDGAQTLFEAAWSSADYHTGELAPAVSDAFVKTGADWDALGAMAVALGPGSFTGLRVGLALAKGLVLARQLALVGVPTLDFVAAGIQAPDACPGGATPAGPAQLAAMLRAGRGRLAVGWYQAVDGAWQSTQPVEVLTLPDLARKISQPTWVCGELDESERKTLAHSSALARLASPAASLRRPAFLAELGWRRWQAGQVDQPAGLAPIYLHYNEPIRYE